MYTYIFTFIHAHFAYADHYFQVLPKDDLSAGLLVESQLLRRANPKVGGNWNGGFLSHRDSPKSSKSLDHDLVLKAWWLGLALVFRKPPNTHGLVVKIPSFAPISYPRIGPLLRPRCIRRLQVQEGRGGWTYPSSNICVCTYVYVYIHIIRYVDMYVYMYVCIYIYVIICT
jgi:hypothetical protein